MVGNLQPKDIIRPSTSQLGPQGCSPQTTQTCPTPDIICHIRSGYKWTIGSLKQVPDCPLQAGLPVSEISNVVYFPLQRKWFEFPSHIYSAESEISIGIGNKNICHLQCEGKAGEVSHYRGETKPWTMLTTVLRLHVHIYVLIAQYCTSTGKTRTQIQSSAT